MLDGKRPINLNIKKTDVTKADTKDAAHCAIANACRRELHVKEARIHLGRIYLRNNDTNWVRYATPRSLRSEIIAFDRGGEFAIGEYTLPILSPSHRERTGEKHGPNNGRGKKKGPARRKPHIVTNVRLGPA